MCIRVFSGVVIRERGGAVHFTPFSVDWADRAATSRDGKPWTDQLPLAPAVETISTFHAMSASHEEMIVFESPAC